MNVEQKEEVVIETFPEKLQIGENQYEMGKMTKADGSSCDVMFIPVVEKEDPFAAFVKTMFPDVHMNEMIRPDYVVPFFTSVPLDVCHVCGSTNGELFTQSSWISDLSALLHHCPSAKCIQIAEMSIQTYFMRRLRFMYNLESNIPRKKFNVKRTSGAVDDAWSINGIQLLTEADNYRFKGISFIMSTEIARKLVRLEDFIAVNPLVDVTQFLPDRIEFVHPVFKKLIVDSLLQGEQCRIACGTTSHSIMSQ